METCDAHHERRVIGFTDDSTPFLENAGGGDDRGIHQIQRRNLTQSKISLILKFAEFASGHISFAFLIRARGEYALALYWLSMRWVLKKLAFREMHDLMTCA